MTISDITRWTAATVQVSTSRPALDVPKFTKDETHTELSENEDAQSKRSSAASAKVSDSCSVIDMSRKESQPAVSKKKPTKTHEKKAEPIKKQSDTVPQHQAWQAGSEVVQPRPPFKPPSFRYNPNQWPPYKPPPLPPSRRKHRKAKPTVPWYYPETVGGTLRTVRELSNVVDRGTLNIMTTSDDPNHMLLKWLEKNFPSRDGVASASSAERMAAIEKFSKLQQKAGLDPQKKPILPPPSRQMMRDDKPRRIPPPAAQVVSLPPIGKPTKTSAARVPWNYYNMGDPTARKVYTAQRRKRKKHKTPRATRSDINQQQLEEERSRHILYRDPNKPSRDVAVQQHKNETVFVKNEYGFYEPVSQLEKKKTSATPSSNVSQLPDYYQKPQDQSRHILHRDPSVPTKDVALKQHKGDETFVKNQYGYYVPMSQMEKRQFPRTSKPQLPDKQQLQEDKSQHIAQGKHRLTTKDVLLKQYKENTGTVFVKNQYGFYTAMDQSARGKTEAHQTTGHRDPYAPQPPEQRSKHFPRVDPSMPTKNVALQQYDEDTVFVKNVYGFYVLVGEPRKHKPKGKIQQKVQGYAHPSTQVRDVAKAPISKMQEQYRPTTGTTDESGFDGSRSSSSTKDESLKESRKSRTASFKDMPSNASYLEKLSQKSSQKQSPEAERESTEDMPSKTSYLEKLSQRSSQEKASEPSRDSMKDASSWKSDQESMKGTPLWKSDQESIKCTPSQKSDQESVKGMPSQKSYQESIKGTPSQKSYQENIKGTPSWKSDQDSIKGMPSQKSDAESMKGTPSQKSYQESVKGSPSQKSHQESIKGTPSQKSYQESVKGLPSQKSDQESIKGTPSQKSYQESVKGTPSQKSGQESVKGTPSQKLYEESVKDMPSQKSDAESIMGTPSQKSYQESVKDMTSQKSDQESVKDMTSQKSYQESVKGMPSWKSDQDSIKGMPSQKSDQESVKDMTSQKSDQESAKGTPSQKSHQESVNDITSQKSHQESIKDMPSQNSDQEHLSRKSEQGDSVESMKSNKDSVQSYLPEIHSPASQHSQASIHTIASGEVSRMPTLPAIPVVAHGTSRPSSSRQGSRPGSRASSRPGSCAGSRPGSGVVTRVVDLSCERININDNNRNATCTRKCDNISSDTEDTLLKSFISHTKSLQHHKVDTPLASSDRTERAIFPYQGYTDESVKDVIKSARAILTDDNPPVSSAMLHQ